MTNELFRLGAVVTGVWWWRTPDKYEPPRRFEDVTTAPAYGTASAITVELSLRRWDGARTTLVDEVPAGAPNFRLAANTSDANAPQMGAVATEFVPREGSGESRGSAEPRCEDRYGEMIFRNPDGTLVSIRPWVRDPPDLGALTKRYGPRVPRTAADQELGNTASRDRGDATSRKRWGTLGYTPTRAGFADPSSSHRARCPVGEQVLFRRGRIASRSQDGHVFLRRAELRSRVVESQRGEDSCRAAEMDDVDRLGREPTDGAPAGVDVSVADGAGQYLLNHEIVCRSER